MKLKIQEHLLEHGMGAETLLLLDKLGINWHEETGSNGVTYVHFDYSIKGTKGHPIVNECRGLALVKDTWEIARMGFTRFMNYGEGGQDPFDFNKPFTCEEKLDGSLIILHWLRGIGWVVGTRGRIFPDAKVQGYDVTFPELFWQIFDKSKMDLLRKEYCYILEICSPLNRVVVRYEPKLVLTGMRHTDHWADADHWMELADHVLDTEAKTLGFERPEVYNFKNIQDCFHYLTTLTELKEGFVVKQWNYDLNRYCRAKIKSEEYIALHHITSIKSLPSLLRLVITQNRNALKDFPEYLPAYDIIDREVKEFCMAAESHYQLFATLLRDESKEPKVRRKDFALNVAKTPYSAICFGLADGKIQRTWDYIASNNDRPGIRRLIDLLDLSRVVGTEWQVIDNEEDEIVD